MNEFWDVMLDALIDTAKILPLLFIVYYVIEIFEYKYASKLHNNKLLKGKASPVFGSLIGCIPQCGFSVVSTDLFSKGIISVGALVAVFVATSDEAIPIMFANPKAIGWMGLLIAIKIVAGIGMGYLAIWLYGLIFNKKEVTAEVAEEHIVDGGCCHHHVESQSFDWIHPLLHCLKISVFILIVNVVFGLIIMWVGEENLKAFLQSSLYLQPILAVLIGLIPNCASSVVLTELFLVEGLKFGALVAGLCVNAGLGLIMLVKQNKNVQENIFIVSILVFPSLVLGYLLLLI